ncbi:MAG: Rne/Rng family ribonuclease, partial [Alphaproteobacteria bacterium]|nr:Rne/Rng family ribonuclease [Alphaproteobacteria bacterium]
MSKKMLIDATHAEETRVVVVDGNKVEEFDFESINKRQLAGNIYLAKVTRVEPSLQAAFVDYGGNRHGFLAFSEIHPDYYQIPVADREALLAEEAAYAKQQAEDEEKKPKSRGRRRGRGKSKAASNADAVVSEEVASTDIQGMDVVDVEAEGDTNEPILDFSSADVTATDTKKDDDAPEAENSDNDAQTSEWAEEQAKEAEEDAADDDTDDDTDSGDETDEGDEALDENSEIESVAQEDDVEEIRPRRKPRPRRYKIQEVIKVRQILLIQVVKEERGNKGAALTTYLSLAGRYCVLMPNTARGGGISRKITNAPDRKKLKEIANNIEVPQGAGLIIRTAGAKRTKAEIKRDYDYLLRQWEQVRDLTLKSIAPAPIYEEGSLIKRSIRDLYNREIDEILIEGEGGYRMAKDYMKMLMPSHAKNVKHYTDPLPLFARFQVESYLSGMFNPTVQLKSGGYIVIGVTEALVAIDVNSGRATKENSIEETATKTNLEAAEEVARQLRLRDLAGLIVIDFIDMEDRRNNAAVEKRIKDRLKTDRARIQVGRISGFGLMEMSRQRLRPGMIEATTAPCPHCHGTGLTRSDDSLALSILRELEEEGVRRRSREVLITAPIAIANYMLNQKREHVAMIEGRYGLSIRIEASPTLISPEYTLERFRTATRVVPEASADVVSMETSLGDAPKVEHVDEAEAEAEAAPTPEAGEDGAPKKKRRRRRRRGGRGRNGDQNREDGGEGENQAAEAASEEPVNADAPVEAPVKADAPAPEPDAEPAVDTAVEAVVDTEVEPEVEAQEKPKKPARKRTTKRASSKAKKAEEAEEKP